MAQIKKKLTADSADVRRLVAWKTAPRLWLRQGDAEAAKVYSYNPFNLRNLRFPAFPNP